MKIKTWIKYEKSYLSSRCKKLHYCECEEYINLTLKEVDKEELKIAFEDNSYSGKGKIYFYNGKLWCKSKMPSTSIVEDLREKGIKINTPLDYMIWGNKYCSTYFFLSWERTMYGRDTSRDAAIKAARDDLKRHILVANELFEQTKEPRYYINTFGLGNNHGGTGIFCKYSYDFYTQDDYFSALEWDQAVAYANEIAKSRGDTDDIGRFVPFIICHMPEVVNVKPRRLKNE